jgi:hypothetical protein
MARCPDWFPRPDAILDVVRSPATPDRLGRAEVKAVFAASERDAIRLLHKFGAAAENNALSLPRSSLLIRLEAIRAGSAFAAFSRQRQGVARQLAAARAESSARQFPVRPLPEEKPRALEELPDTIGWRHPGGAGPGRMEIRYDDGADLMGQLAEFLAAAGGNREEFLERTEPAEASPAKAAR